MFKSAILTLGLACGIAGSALAGPEFHVALDGSDENAGSEAASFRTIARARDAIRASGKKEGAAVVIHGGTHFIPEPVELTKEDSGAANAPVIYRAAEGEEVWLSGGIPLNLDAFTPVTDKATRARLDPAARDKVRQLQLSEEQKSRLSPEWPATWWYYHRGDVTSLSELFLGDERLPMARWPNDGYTTFGEIIASAENEGETPIFRYKGDRPERWVSAVPEGLWLYGYWRRGYRAEFVRVQSIDTATRQIELAARNSLGALEGGGASRYRALHVLEELDAPGEWFLDRRRGVLFFWPPETPPGSRVVLSVNPNAIFHGTDTAHIEFRNLGIECSAGCGIRIDKGTACRVVACEIRNVGTHGIVVTGDRNQVVGCDIHHTGDKAIDLDSGDRDTLTRGESLIDNCHLHHTNQIVRAGSQAVSFLGVGNRLSHNVIHDTGYIAIRFAGNDHVMEHNRLFRTNVESAEGGVFYTGRDWTSRGSVIRHNFIHHVEDTQEGCGSSTRFVHLDDSAPEIDIHGNVCYRLGGGVSICGGAANQVHDNLFVECAWGVDIGPRGHEMFAPDGQGGFKMGDDKRGWSSLAKYLHRYRWNQPPYSTLYPKLGEIFTKRPIAAPWFNTVTRNVMVDCGRGIREQNMEPGWSTVENNWEGEDPGFVEKDRTRLDFRLADSAVVCREIGFRPPTVEKAGLYESPDRRSWPVKLDLPPKDWKPRWMRLREAAANSPAGLPVFKAMQVTGTLVIDGVVDPMEWAPGDATGKAPEIHDTAELVWNEAGEKAGRPSQAMVQTDDGHLYIQFRNEVDPENDLTTGHRWDRDDAVEIALAEIGGKENPAVVLHGFPDGFWQPVSQAGATERLRNGAIEYAAKVVSPALWTAEWKIPFAALGLEPKKANPRLVFNLSVRKTAGPELVMLKQKGGDSRDVAGGTLLWLAQFGEMTVPNLKPSNAVIHIQSVKKTGEMLEPVSGCEVCDWAKPLGHRLSADRAGLPTGSWQDFEFSFVSKIDGEVSLILLGDGYTNPATNEQLPVWVYMDDLRVEGAEFHNGDFEERLPDGSPAAWRLHVKPGVSIHDPDLAISGSWLVKVAHDCRYYQTLRLTAGQVVTVRAKVRGLPVQRTE